MASPPFDINAALPGDSDIVSQHPVNARAFRDIVESWLLINHNNLGQHTRVELPFTTPAPTAVANVGTIYVDVDGNVKFLTSGSDEYLQAPPGSYLISAAPVVPAGYLNADGSAVSRSTFAALFAAISTTYGVGNGTTTFNIPDARGRVLAALDQGTGRLASITALGQAGGNNSTVTIGTSNLPPYTPAGSVVNGAITAQFVIDGQSNLNAIAGWTTHNAGSQGAAQTVPSLQGTSGNLGAFFTQQASSFFGSAQGGSSVLLSILQSTLGGYILIKY